MAGAGHEPEIASWCLNGNHDMYSGGHDFFEFLLADSRFARQERSSFFSLSNDRWQVLALDTAHTEDDLNQTQVNWIASQTAASARKLILLSHHQLFSSYETTGEQLKQRLGSVLDSGSPF